MVTEGTHELGHVSTCELRMWDTRVHMSYVHIHVGHPSTHELWHASTCTQDRRTDTCGLKLHVELTSTGTACKHNNQGGKASNNDSQFGLQVLCTYVYVLIDMLYFTRAAPDIVVWAAYQLTLRII